MTRHQAINDIVILPTLNFRRHLYIPTTIHNYILKTLSGTPMEASLLRLVEGVEGHTQTFRSLHPKVCEVPYSSISKLQLTIHEARDFQTNGYLLTMFGEPETVLNRSSSSHIFTIPESTNFIMKFSSFSQSYTSQVLSGLLNELL